MVRNNEFYIEFAIQKWLQTLVAPLVDHLTRVIVESIIIGRMKMLLQGQTIFIIFLLGYKIDSQIEENNETFKLKGHLVIND